MSLLEKVKNFFYDEEDEDGYEDEVKPKPKVQKEKIKKEVIYDNEKQEISERELFKAERTFNFPMDFEDETEFTPKREESPKEEKKEVIKKEYTTEYKSNPVPSIRNYTKYEGIKEEAKEEAKKFKPTPVISPIYGVLDKNYKKEDLLIDSAKEKEEVKKVDYDTVRRKAYGSMYPEDEDKGIFFNLDDQNKEEETDEDDVKIIYNDVTLEDEEDDKNMTIGEKIEAYEKSLQDDDIDYDEEDEDNQILSETKEQDLFNLIDNMYNSDEDDDDEEE